MRIKGEKVIKKYMKSKEMAEKGDKERNGVR